MNEKDAKISMSSSVSGVKMTATNPETGEGFVLNLAPSQVAEVKAVFSDE